MRPVPLSTIPILLPLLFPLLFPILFLLTPVPAESQVYIRAESGTTNHLRAVDFFDDSLGLIVGDGGTILRTSDAGATWETIPTGTTTGLSCVSWLSGSTAIAAGFSGVLLRSGDAGVSWTGVPSGTTLPIAGCDGWDSLNAIVAGYNGFILRTIDGGISWSLALQQPGANHLGVAYADSLTVCVSGSYGRMLRSTDGGVSWTWQSYGVFTLNDVEFTDSANGIAVGSGGNTRLRTTDAGGSWTAGPLVGTFDDIDRGLSGGAMAVGIGTAQSLNGGVTWSAKELPVRLRGVALFDPARHLIVGDNGLILRSAQGTVIPPPPVLGHPVDNAADVPLSPDWQKEFSLSLSWPEYGPYFPERFRLQVSPNPDFSGIPHLDSTYRINVAPDTQRTVKHIFPGRPYYWRLRMMFDGVESPWSEVRTFRGGIGHASVTIRDIQLVEHDSLLTADSLTAAARDWWSLQASPLLDTSWFLTVRCVASPTDLYDPHYIYHGASAGTFFHAVDTGATAATRWGGIRVTPGWFSGGAQVGEEVARVGKGDLVVMAGSVSEDPWGSMNSETSFFVDWLFILDSGGVAPVPGPVPASAGDFFRPAGQNQQTLYSTGEPLEGVYVELTDLTVHSFENEANGTFRMTDRDGALISSADYSRWFTLRPHRDPASLYQLPHIGRHIDTLRGYISTTSGDANSWIYPRYRVAPVTPGDIVYGPPTGNLMRGAVYYDSSRNGTRDSWEPGIAGWQLTVGGLVSATIASLPDGSFGAAGLDSGIYSIQLALPEGWFISSSGPPMVDVTLGIGDTLDLPPFGIYFGWNRISGRVFDDLNENGSPDPGEPGMPGIIVLLDGAERDTAVTDGAGEYRFDELRKGVDTVRIILPPQWEQIVPSGGGGIFVDFREYDRHVTERDFSLRRAPARLKVGITVRDSGDLATRTIVFGTRPGASDGVWGADSAATFIDFSEGEFEIPPQIFGLFDARFIDPRGGIGRFGEGTWTDMREYRSDDQVDSFRIDFQPGLLLGGSYPMRFFWSRAAVESAYTGPVTIGDGGWNPQLDLKAADSLIVADTSIGILTIIAAGPVLRVSDVSPYGETPGEFTLMQNFPNPFNPATDIAYTVAARSRVTLRVYDILGRPVATLVDAVKAPGSYVERWEGGRLPSGVYFCRMTAEGFTGMMKMLLVR